MSQIVTGDAVVLDLRPARTPTRILADLVDIAIMMVLAWGWSWVTAEVSGSAAGLSALGLLGYILVCIGYPVIFETLTRGRTAGAYLLGLQVVRDDGGSIRFRHALMRGLCFWLVDYSIYTGFLLGTIVSATNPTGKRVGDILAGTMEIRIRAPRAARPLPETAPHLAQWASTLEMSRVTNEQFAAIRAALQRDKIMRPAYRSALLLDLAARISRLTAPQPPAGTPPEEYLTAVISENRRRAGVRLQSRLVPTASELPQGFR